MHRKPTALLTSIQLYTREAVGLIVEQRAGGRSKVEAGSRGLAAVLLIVLMAIGSIAMWVVVPLGLVYLASQLQDRSQPSLGPYLVVLFGLPIGMVAIGKVLGRLDRYYHRLTNTERDVRVQPLWMKSMRGERGSGRPFRMLNVVMVISVTLAAICFAVWFFGFAGSSLPH
jgi:hypothetical protein